MAVKHECFGKCLAWEDGLALGDLDWFGIKWNGRASGRKMA
jgi:hypothetical protein